MKITTKIFLIIVISLVHYSVMVFLDGGNYFDFSNNRTYGKLIMSIIVATTLQFLVKPGNKENKSS